MNFLFNEKSAIENMINMKVVDNDNIFVTIKDLARYNYFVYNMDKDNNYKSILKYLQKNGQNINEENVKLAKEYHTQIFQDNEIATVLADNGAGRLLEVQKRVTESLDEYERLMKSIVMTRDQLPLEKQMEQEKHV